MKKSLLLFSFLIINLSLHGPEGYSAVIASASQKKPYIRETAFPNINIYPVPVRENSFTIKTDREMSALKVTNMIGQDIFRAQYKNPLSFAKVLLAKSIPRNVSGNHFIY